MERSSSVSRRDSLLLLLLCAALYLPGLTAIPPVDRDEPRYAQATRQMLESGNYTLPHFGVENRFKKPIGIYWLQAAAVRITAGGEYRAIWPYRLPSVLGASAAVLLTYWFGRRLFAREVALFGAAFLASSALLVVEAHVATTDAVLLACVVTVQGCLAGLYSAAKSGHVGRVSHAMAFWLAQGSGVLIKGPIIVLVSGLTLGTLLGVERWRGQRSDTNRNLLAGLRWHWGFAAMLAISLPWIAVAGWETHGSLYRDWLNDVAPKALSAQESHAGPPGYYMVLSAVTFWPASFAAAAGVVYAWRYRTRTAERFCLAWLIPTWVFFEMMPTKLPHYVLPTYPALALLAAQAIRASRDTVLPYPRVLRAAFILWTALTLALGVAILVGAATLGGGVGVAPAFAALSAIVVAVVGLRLGWRRQLVPASAVAVIGSAVLWIATLQWVVPQFGAVWLSRAAAAAVTHQGASRLAAVGYNEPSLAFLTAGDVAFMEPQDAARFLREIPNGLVLVSDDRQAAFARAVMDIGLSVREIWAMDGINYSKGRRTRLALFEQVPDAVS